VLMLNTGCGKKPSSEPTSGKGEALYWVKAPEKTTVVLDRTGKRSELSLPPEYSLYDSDIIENTGKKPAIVHEIKKGHKFTLAPSARVKLNDQMLTLYQGGTRFEFKKVHGEFKVVLPNSVSLGIRGTDFVVVLNPDGQSVVKMLEGEIIITQEGKGTPLKTPESALIGPASAPVKIFTDPDKLPAGLLPESVSDFLGLGSDSKTMEGTRQSHY